MRERLQTRLWQGGTPPTSVGIGVAAVSVALVTASIYPLSEISPRISNSILYLLPVLLVSTVWGLRLGLLTCFASALAFNFFHIHPTGRLTIADSRNWVALLVFLISAVASGTLADTARRRALEAERRRREADLLTDLAQLLLSSSNAHDASSVLARRLSEAFDLRSAAIDSDVVEGDQRRRAIPLVADGRPIGTLLVPADLPQDVVESLEVLAKPLSSLLAASARREELEKEVVETEALRQSDVVKTALLRTVSHDLRSPLTAISTASDGLFAGSSGSQKELASVIREEVDRLSHLIDDLLDLSRLQAGSATPRRTLCSIEEIAEAAIASLPRGEMPVRLRFDEMLPLVDVDAAQIERSLANLLSNAASHAGGEPVTVSGSSVGDRIRIQVSDHGPGIPRGELERIFEPFYRGQGKGRGGVGLGLAIARGFVEANGGRLSAESLPRQGTTFVIELPLPSVALPSVQVPGDVAL